MARFANIASLVRGLCRAARRDAPRVTAAEPLEGDLHELAESLQAASNYLGLLRYRSANSGSDQATQAAILEKAAQQLVRAEEGLRRLRRRLAQKDS